MSFNWPTAVAFSVMMLGIWSFAIVDKLGTQPLVIRMEADDNMRYIADVASTLKDQQLIVVNETVASGCSMNITNCASTILMFAGHSESPQPYFNTSNVHVHNRDIVIDSYADKIYWTRTIGDSMKPFIGNATLLYRKPRNFDDIKIGDILIYNASNSQGELYIVHQVVRKTDTQYYTKGFNNPGNDARNITYDKTLGIVVGVLY